MLLDERTLIVVADGAHARLIEERRRGGPLHERDDWSAGLSPSGRRGSGSPGRVFERAGHGSHPVGGADPHELAEERFMAAIADRVGELEAKHAFDALALIAPPRALGRLRAALSHGARSRLRYAESKDRVKSDLETLRQALADMRRRGS